jgi:chemotaxis protein CheD
MTPSGWAEATAGPVKVFLSPGTLYCAAEPSRVTTILGSCVSLCLWDSRLRVGGINHYLLPHRCDAGSGLRFGDIAIEQLLEEMRRLGCQAGSLRAKLFGGAAVLGLATGGDPVGDQNVRVALDKLSRYGIPMIARTTGGRSGMLIRLWTESGDVTVRHVVVGATQPVPHRQASR